MMKHINWAKLDYFSFYEIPIIIKFLKNQISSKIIYNQIFKIL